MDEKYISKAKQGCSLFFFHSLLYSAASALFIIVGLIIATANVRVNTASDVIATAGSFLILFPAWILFTIVWISAVLTLRSLRKSAARRAEAEVLLAGTGVTRGDLQKVLSEGREKTAMMRSLAQKVHSAAVQEKIRAIADSSNRIYGYLEKEPSAARQARQFINYYNDAALTIVKKYATIADHSPAEIAVPTLRRVEASLDSIHDSFNRQYEKLLDGSLTEIDVELSLLKKTLKSEGLSVENS